MASKKYEIGRFDYVEPVNPNLDKSDTEMINKPEDYCISVNLEVTIPSRFYEEEPTYLNASSDNGTVSFFGGVDTGNNNEEPKQGQKGFLSTSWTDISVNTTDKGNKDSIGIESINISYSPTFFPVVTIKFVDVRGASLFMPQEKAYEIYTNSSDMGNKVFQSSSFFKSLFSIPSPIFKLTVKGFYGQSVSYKLMMSKSDFDFDSQNGNFTANVQFAGYMYGIYTELPMSYIALAPYIDNLAYWNEKNFTFKNGAQIPTISEFVVKIVEASKNAEQTSSQSPIGKDLNQTSKIYNVLKQLKTEFPFKNFLVNNTGENKYETSQRSKRGVNVNTKVDFDKDGNLVDKLGTFVKANEADWLEVYNYSLNKKVFYYFQGENNKEIKAGIKRKSLDVVPIPVNKGLYFLENSGEIESYKKLIEELERLDDNLASKYKQDFEEILRDVGYDNNVFFEANKPKHCSMPVYCYVEYDNKNNAYSFYGLNTINLGKQKGKYCKVVSDTAEGDVLTHFVYFDHFHVDREDGMPVELDEEMVSQLKKRITGSGLSKENTPMCIWRIATNILDYLDKDLEVYERQESDLTNEVCKIKSEEAGKLLGFNLSIENIYTLIFAHIDTFMHHYYNVLKETNEDTNRTKVICDNKGSVCDVPDKILSQNKVPPYPTFVKEENNKKILTWPYDVLKQQIPETLFVEKIINAATQTENEMSKAFQEIDRLGKTDNVAYSSNLNNLIPTNSIDLLNNSENPYTEAYNFFKEKGEVNVINKIWYTFALRCYYFMYMYRKYRNSKSDIEKACGYFGMSEAVNIKKLFGEKVAKEFITQLTSNGAENSFFTMVKSEKIFSDTNPAILKYNHVEKEIDGVKYASLPVDTFNKEKEDISKYVLIGLDGKAISGSSEINKDAIRIIDNPYYFEGFTSLIEGDNDFKDFGSDFDKFVEDMFTNYFGGKILSTNGNNFCPYADYNKNGKAMWFTSISSDGYKSIDYDEALKLNSSDVCLIEDKKKFTSYINDYACIDTINVIAAGTNENKNHFVKDITNEEVLRTFGFLNLNSSTNFDIAYYFLWSLPIDEEYGRIASNSNFNRVARVVLLREGAQYYWEDNCDEMKSHIISGFGVTLSADTVPIVNKKGVKFKTLHITKEEKDEYCKWSDFVDKDRELSTNRRNFLKEYFVKWVNEEFSKLRNSFENFDINSKECKESGLTQSLTSRIMNLYLNEVILTDYSAPIINDNKGSKIKTRDGDKDVENFYKESYKSFKKVLSDIYLRIPTTEFSVVSNLNVSSNTSDDVKLAVYLTLQTIYNKFVAGNKVNRWTLGDKDSDFNSFLYLDTYYKEIGQLLYLNGKRIVDIFKQITPDITALANDKEGSNRNSVYNFMSDMCAKNGINLIAMPINPYIFATQGSSRYGQPVAWDLFDTIPYTQMETRDTSCFISLYTYRPSSHLDIQDDNHLYGYENDGFDINVNGEKDLPVQLQSFGRRDGVNEVRVPSFAVTYAKQNQSIFKNINVSTTNFQTTDTAIQMTLNIAAKGDEPPRQSVVYGQDIFSVYSNYAYMCEVEMMGCAPISPMMYFQLNNIPMFKGAYLIYNVEHNIVAGNMTTKFKGNRVNKHAIPFAKADVIYQDEYNNTMAREYFVSDNPESYINTVENLAELGNATPEEIKYRLIKMKSAVDNTFNCANEETGKCSKYVYNIAYAYKNGTTPCYKGSLRMAGGNAKEKGFHDSLLKLGYKLDVEKAWITKEELKGWIEKDNVNIGDVYVYCSDDPQADSAYLYGHAQIFTGINNTSSAEIKNKGACNWASSVKNNYGSNFIYNSNSRPGKWHLWVFRANLDK